MKIVVSTLPVAMAFLFGAPAIANAHVHRSYHDSRHRLDRGSLHDSGGLIHEKTAAGAITVAADAAEKFKGLIDSLKAIGFHGDVHCYASGGHVTHSLHSTGHACDFAQTGKNKTVSIMYHSGALIRSFGLRDGCSFGDCGHVDTGLAAERPRHGTVVARNERRHRERIVSAQLPRHSRITMGHYGRHYSGDDDYGERNGSHGHTRGYARVAVYEGGAGGYGSSTKDY